VYGLLQRLAVPLRRRLTLGARKQVMQSELHTGDLHSRWLTAT
jgi:hypothetical protein